MPKETIRFAFEISQHGAISPSYNISSEYNDYFGETWRELNGLTLVGQRQQYILGYHTRLRYIEDNSLLSRSFDPREIYVIATNANCTILSANAQLQGLYPPETGATLNQRQIDFANPPNDLGYYKNERELLGTNALPDRMTIIPIHNFIASDHTFELTNPDNCPSMADILTNKSTSPQAKSLINTFITQYGDKIAAIIGQAHTNAFNNYTLTKTVIETLISNQYDGRAFSKVKQAGINIKELLDYCHEFLTYDLLYTDDSIKESVLTSMSPTFSKIIQWIKLKVSNDLNGQYDSSDYSPPKFVLYVSYAPSIVAFQSFVRYIWPDAEVSYPRFASSAFIELIHTATGKPSSENDYIIRYRFNNKQYSDVSYSNFINKAGQLIRSTDDIKLFCGWVYIKPEFNYYIVIVFVLIAFCIILVGLIFLICIKK